MNDTELSALRQQIDALDDKIISLIIERTGVVANVGALKNKALPGQCHIRPGREADMVRRVMQKFEGSAFNPSAAAAMWRILIGCSTCVESPLTLSVYTPDRNDTLYWLAREYFGPTLPVIRQPHIKRVIGDVMDGKASVGIVPTLHDDAAGEWWPALMPASPQAPKVFAHVPFIYENTPGAIIPMALAIGLVAPEETGNDRSLLVLDTDYNLSQNRLQTAFVKAGLEAQWISISTPASSTTRRHLIEFKGFIAPSHAAMKAAVADLGTVIQNIVFLGAYATPLILNTNAPAIAYAAHSAKA